MKTLKEVIERRVESHPNKEAYIVVERGQESKITYKELFEKIVKKAEKFKKYQGERIILMYYFGEEFLVNFWGAIYAGVVVVPLAPIRNKEGIENLERIIHQIQPKGIVTTEDIKERILKIKQIELLKSWERGEKGKKGEIKEESLAIIQYTSGTTGKPKGVKITHKNIIENSKNIYEIFENRVDSIGCTWLPNYHDMGLIGGIVQPIYGGFTNVIFSHLEFMQNPIKWIKYISKYEATISGAPNFAYELINKKVKKEKLYEEKINVSKWETAFCGAEPVRKETLEKFATLLEPFGFKKEAFLPCYGMAENTLIITGKRGLCEIKEGIVSVGKPKDTLVKIGKEGEILIKGKSLSKGYWGELNGENKEFNVEIDGESGYFNTGDIGEIIEGELGITGRKKEIIIVRGKNHYKPDLEDKLTKIEGVEVNGALIEEIQGEESIRVLLEVNRETFKKKEKEKIKQEVRAILGEIGLKLGEIEYYLAGSLPKTTSGKIKRKT